MRLLEHGSLSLELNNYLVIYSLEMKISNLEEHMEDLKKLLGALVGYVPTSV